MARSSRSRAIAATAAADSCRFSTPRANGGWCASDLDGLTALGAAPSLTPDGKIVAFAGDRGNGGGVFLSIQYAPGKRRLVRIVGENANVQKAELGYDANLNKLYFSSIELDSRVGIIYT